MSQDGPDDPWSVTDKELFDQMRAARAEGAVVATVADVEGTAYRRPGAKMLIQPDGRTAGAVTAGCLEEPVVELAAEVLQAATPRLEEFDLMETDDDRWGLGLGCNGIIDVFLEPLDESWASPLDRLSRKEPVSIVTAIDSDAGAVPVGSRSIVDEPGETREAPPREAVPESYLTAIEETIETVHGSGKAVAVSAETANGDVRLLVDGLVPVTELLLFGNQNDINPLSKLATQVGFEVTVCSPRAADEDAFPAADRVRTVRPPDVAEAVENPEHTYAVVMSHNLVDDRMAVESLLAESTVPYVGLMGPRERFQELRAGSDVIDDENLDRLATPVGLDLGGGEPIEIALSITSEVLAVKNGRDGGRLTDKKGPIHTRIAAEEN